VAFFSAGTLPGVDEELDKVCFKHFIEQTNQEESK